MDKQDKKEQILELLKGGEKSESSIACEVTLNQPYTKKYLLSLKEEGKVKLREEQVGKEDRIKTRNYWSLA